MFKCDGIFKDNSIDTDLLRGTVVKELRKWASYVADMSIMMYTSGPKLGSICAIVWTAGKPPRVDRHSSGRMQSQLPEKKSSSTVTH